MPSPAGGIPLVENQACREWLQVQPSLMLIILIQLLRIGIEYKIGYVCCMKRQKRVKRQASTHKQSGIPNPSYTRDHPRSMRSSKQGHEAQCIGKSSQLEIEQTAALCYCQPAAVARRCGHHLCAEKQDLSPCCRRCTKCYWVFRSFPCLARP